ncbi:ABC transporter ATP-binding protein [Alphaproteobacteria bacterium]|nr:ABC transporter ATP-binding protein [Alphaproteobacteria bacterium]
MSKRKDKSVTRRTIHYYWQEMKRSSGLTILALVMTPLVIFGRVALVPFVTAEIIQLVSAGNIPDDQLWPTMLPYILAVAGGYLLSSVILGEIRLFAVWRMEIAVMYRLSDKCFTKLSQQSMHFHNNRFGGSLVSQTGKFVGAFERLFDTMIWEVLPMVLSIIYVSVILWQSVPVYVIFLLAFVAGYIIFAYLSFRRVGDLNKAEAEAENKRSGRLSDAVTNILAVKSYGREKDEQHGFRTASRRVFNASNNLLKAVIRRDIVFSLINTAILVLIAIFLVGGPGWFAIPIATMVLIVTYTHSVTDRLWDVNGIFRGYNRAIGDAYEMTKILDLPEDVKDAPDAKALEVKQGGVCFDDVSFTHADGKDTVFHHLDLDIEPGQRVGLVGRSGSGKTTLTKLLLRFADVDSGAITIDGQNISEVTQVSLRHAIAYVPQETTLFHRTIAENIAYGRPNATRDEIIYAAKQASAWEFIKDLPKGLDTLTGERGVKLSGGQRQRIAIARAILKDAPILVLDEATASLDTESEKLIQEALSRLMKGRTSIVIAHRLSTVAELDRIVVLDEGEIIEDDTHASLIAEGGIYAQLWNKQTGVIE